MAARWRLEYSADKQSPTLIVIRMKTCTSKRSVFLVCVIYLNCMRDIVAPKRLARQSYLGFLGLRDISFFSW